MLHCFSAVNDFLFKHPGGIKTLLVEANVFHPFLCFVVVKALLPLGGKCRLRSHCVKKKRATFVNVFIH